MGRLFLARDIEMARTALRDGKPARHQKSRKIGKENGKWPQARDGQKIPTEMAPKNGQKMAKKCGFHFGGQIFWPFRAWGHFPFSFPFSRDFWCRAGFPFPKGPKIEQIQDHPPGLKFSSEIEMFKRATHQTPYFCGEF